MLTKRDLLRSAALAAMAVTTARPIPALRAGRPPRLLQGQGHRRGRLHLRPADRDELRGDVRIRRRSRLGPVQGAVQPDQERAPRLHLQGHGDHHAQQRHAVFVRVAGPARRADRAVRAGGGEGALLLGHARRRQHVQLRLHRQPRHRQRGRRLHGRRARTGRATTPAGIKKVFRSTTAVLARRLPHAALQSRGHAQRR